MKFSLDFLEFTGNQRKVKDSKILVGTSPATAAGDARAGAPDGLIQHVCSTATDGDGKGHTKFPLRELPRLHRSP